MPRAGESVFNPATGERITFLATAADTGGELLQMRSELQAGFRRGPAHVHPAQEERFEVVAGRVMFRVGDERGERGPGDVVVVPPGTVHQAYNAGGGPAVMLIEFRPALRWEHFVVALFELTGRVLDGDARAEIDLGLLMRDHADELRLAG